MCIVSRTKKDDLPESSGEWQVEGYPLAERSVTCEQVGEALADRAELSVRKRRGRWQIAFRAGDRGRQGAVEVFGIVRLAEGLLLHQQVDDVLGVHCLRR